MTRTYRAELARLLRRRVVLTTALVAVVFGAGGTLLVLASLAETAGPGRARTAASFAVAGGGTDVFRLAVSFAGTFVFVTCVGLVAAEFSRGTFRTMLLRQPRRLPLLAGKLAALLTFAAGTLALAQAVAYVTALLRAPAEGVDTSAWTGGDALVAGLGDFGALMFWVTGYAVLGTAVGVLLRSVPLALGAGIAWAGPIEHIVGESWGPGRRLFPGLLLEAFVAGGTDEVSAGRALSHLVLYVAVAGVVAAAVFARRDVTG